MSAKFDWWIVLGFIAESFFVMRFIVQWLASERAGNSVVPFSFWLFSFGGGALLLIYDIGRSDPIFILSQGLNLIIYSRNIFLIRKRANSTVR